MKYPRSYRTGFFRLWLLASAVWLAFGAWYWSSEIDYAVRYNFRYSETAAEHRDINRQITQFYEAQRDGLSRQHSAAMTRFLEDEKSEYGQALRKADILLPPPEPDPKIAELSKHIEVRASMDEQPSQPSLIWVAGLFAPPLLFFMLPPALFRVARWVWRGFAGI